MSNILLSVKDKNKSIQVTFFDVLKTKLNSEFTYHPYILPQLTQPPSKPPQRANILICAKFEIIFLFDVFWSAKNESEVWIYPSPLDFAPQLPKPLSHLLQRANFLLCTKVKNKLILVTIFLSRLKKTWFICLLSLIFVLLLKKLVIRIF